MKKPSIIIIILFVTALALSLVRIFVSNNIATSGVVLSRIEEEVKVVETQNAVISEKLYSETALSSVSKEAEKLGFKPVNKAFAITTQNPVAFKQ